MSENSDVAGLIGTLLDGRFRVQRLIGRGGLSAVYLAEQEETGRRVAVKVLLPQFSRDQLKAKRFQQEAKILHHLEHPNIAQVYSFGVTGDGNIYLTLEYLEGQDLSQVIDGAPLGTSEIVSIFKQIALAVAYAHQQQVVHRDLKPHNVMVGNGAAGSGASVKVLDFGVAKLMASNTSEQQKLTTTGVLVGTPAYMSPEQTSTAAPDSRSDIYSFGCMLYEALVGHPPFERENYAQLLHAHIKDAPPPIPVAKADKSRQALSAIAFKCLAKQPADRFQSLDRVIELLSQIQSGDDADVDALVKVPMVARRPTSRRLAVIVSLICTGILAALLVLAATQSWSTTPAVQVPNGPPMHQVRAGVFYREQAEKTEDPVERHRLLLKSKATLKEVIKNFEVNKTPAVNNTPAALQRQRENRWELCLTTSAKGLPDKEYKEAVQACLDCAAVDEQLQKVSNKFDRYDIRRRECIALHLAFGMQVFWLGDLRRGRPLAAEAARVDAIDKVHTLFSTWPAEMLARYDRQPERAAQFADQTLVFMRDHGANFDADIVLAYCEEAVIDYIANGMTVKAAKERVVTILRPILQTKKFGDDGKVQRLLNKNMPDDSAAKWSPAYKQPSHGFAGKIPDAVNEGT